MGQWRLLSKKGRPPPSPTAAIVVFFCPSFILSSRTTRHLTIALRGATIGEALFWRERAAVACAVEMVRAADKMVSAGANVVGVAAGYIRGRGEAG